ncbi:MAG: hypothetical protein ACI9W4_002393 [Rhodothermales bacterium]|jgi:hypothetical protein
MGFSPHSIQTVSARGSRWPRCYLAALSGPSLPGELTPEHLALFDREMNRVVEPGTFTVMVGPNSVDLQSISLTVQD